MEAPTKLNDNLIAEMVKALRLGMTIKLSCQYCGIHVSQYYRWLSLGQQQPDSIHARFREAVTRARGKGAAHHLALLTRAANEGNVQASMWLLERCHNFIRRERIEVEQAESELDEVAALEAQILQAAKLIKA